MEADRRAEVWAKTGGRCWYCGTQTSPWKDFHVEHHVPRSQGGTDHLNNLVPSCQPCNNRKGSKTIEEFRLYLQTKAQHTFWFEHVGLPLALSEPEPEKEDIPEISIEYFQECLEACLRFSHLGQGLVLTMIVLLHQADLWDGYDVENNPTVCYGVMSPTLLAQTTGQSVAQLISKLFYLEGKQWLSLDYDSEGQYNYTAHIGEFIQGLRTYDRQHREESLNDKGGET